MGMLKVFAGLAFLAGAGSIAGMILNGDWGLLMKFWDDALLIICGGERGGDETDAKVGKLDGVLRISFVAESSTQEPLIKKQRCLNAIIWL